MENKDLTRFKHMLVSTDAILSAEKELIYTGRDSKVGIWRTPKAKF